MYKTGSEGHKSRRHRSFSGAFTIVELLVVVVVIAILAGISTVAYSGIQQRARFSATTSAIRSYANAFQLYYAEHGSYPPGDWLCLGPPEHYPADSNYASGRCNSNALSYTYPTSTTLMNSLSVYMNTFPNPLTHVPGDHDYGGKVRGLVYDQVASHTNGRATISFWAEGTFDCPIGRKTFYHTPTTSTRCEYLMPL